MNYFVYCGIFVGLLLVFVVFDWILHASFSRCLGIELGHMSRAKSPYLADGEFRTREASP